MIDFDFSGNEPYIIEGNDVSNRVELDAGGSYSLQWCTSDGDPYDRGSALVPGNDFAFRTYMMADYSLSPIESRVPVRSASLTADGTSQTTLVVQLRDAQGTLMTTGGKSVSITSTLGTVSPVTTATAIKSRTGRMKGAMGLFLC